MKKVLIAALFITSISLTTANAEDCIDKACIEVYTQNGQIVIEGRKGSGPVSKTYVSPAPKVVRKVVPRVPKKVVVAPTPSLKPKVTTTKRPVVRKAPRKAPRKSLAITTTTDPTSLQDKLVELLPSAGIAYQPSFEPLVNVPVYFWSDLPEVVTKKVSIVDETVDIKLKPLSMWHFGDGGTYVTTKIGGPYPDGEIHHAYSKPGHYLIELITIWKGEFIIGGITYPITGSVTTVSVMPITVVAAPIRFVSHSR